MMNYIMIIYCQLPSKATVKTEKYNYIKTQIIVSVMPFITMWSMADEDIISGVNRPQDMYNFPIKLSNEIIISAVTSRLFNYLIHFILLLLSLAVMSRSESNLPADLSPVTSGNSFIFLLKSFEGKAEVQITMEACHHDGYWCTNLYVYL